MPNWLLILSNINSFVFFIAFSSLILTLFSGALEDWELQD
jgi:hypothetical protein